MGGLEKHLLMACGSPNFVIRQLKQKVDRFPIARKRLFRVKRLSHCKARDKSLDRVGLESEEFIALIPQRFEKRNRNFQ